MGQHVLTLEGDGRPLTVTYTRAETVDWVFGRIQDLYPRVVDHLSASHYRSQAVTSWDGRRRRAQIEIQKDSAADFVLLPNVVLTLLLEQGWRLHSMHSDLTVLTLE